MQEAAVFWKPSLWGSYSGGAVFSLCAMAGQPTANLTGLPIRLSISTSVSIRELGRLLVDHVGDTRTRNHQDLSAASACFKR